jgi:carbon storage regulator CsrA
MLVLSRKTEESVVVGEADGLGRLLKVTVLGINKGIVRLGFEADDGAPVHRFGRMGSQGRTERVGE